MWVISPSYSHTFRHLRKANVFTITFTVAVAFNGFDYTVEVVIHKPSSTSCAELQPITAERERERNEKFKMVKTTHGDVMLFMLRLGECVHQKWQHLINCCAKSQNFIIIYWAFSFIKWCKIKSYPHDSWTYKTCATLKPFLLSEQMSTLNLTTIHFHPN